MTPANETGARAVAAYGGEALWQEAKSFRAVVSARGLAFTLKQRPPFNYARITGKVHRPYLRLTPIGQRVDVECVLDGEDVRLEDRTGAEAERRAKARHFFPGGRRWFRWDDLDMGYFASYAFWNYFTLPALLMNGDIAWEERERGHLRGNFPAHIPTHGSVQDFFFDPQTGRLERHDYTVDVIGKWARAANRIEAHNSNAGISYPSRRRVTPQGPFGHALPGPLLIGIVVHDFALSVHDLNGSGPRA